MPLSVYFIANLGLLLLDYEVAQKQFLRGCACRLPLIIAIFLRGKVKNSKFLRGVLCRHYFS